MRTLQLAELGGYVIKYTRDRAYAVANEIIAAKAERRKKSTAGRIIGDVRGKMLQAAPTSAEKNIAGVASKSTKRGREVMSDKNRGKGKSPGVNTFKPTINTLNDNKHNTANRVIAPPRV